MRCLGCDSHNLSVVYTRHDYVKNIISRRRACLDCGLRFTTEERIKLPNKDSIKPLYVNAIKQQVTAFQDAVKVVFHPDYCMRVQT